MQLYMAPLEGITGYIYRNAYYKCYGDIDRYFAPFIMSKKLNQKEIRDILPENNKGMELVPQILANRAEDFLAIAKAIQSYGFIGSNVPGIGDLVRDVALLFEFQDDEELALRIKEVLTDRTLYCNVAEKCYSFAKQYDINIISQKYMKLYRSL